MQRPSEQEYHPYYKSYVAKVPNGDIIQILEEQTHKYLPFYQSIPAAKWDYAYAEGKWTIKEVLVHLLDAERVFAYRAMRIARGDSTPLPGFDQDIFVENSNSSKRSVASILQEYQNVRAATLSLFKSFGAVQFNQLGSASNSPVSVRALSYLISGHELHHAEIIKEKYLD